MRLTIPKGKQLEILGAKDALLYWLCGPLDVERTLPDGQKPDKLVDLPKPGGDPPVVNPEDRARWLRTG